MGTCGQELWIEADYFRFRSHSLQALLRLVALCGLGGNACACNCRWHRLQNLPSDMTAATVVSDNVTLRSVSLSRNGWRSTPVRGQLSGAQGLLA